jgi:hypothetical protein
VFKEAAVELSPHLAVAQVIAKVCGLWLFSSWTNALLNQKGSVARPAQGIIKAQHSEHMNTFTPVSPHQQMIGEPIFCRCVAASEEEAAVDVLAKFCQLMRTCP